MESNNQQLNCNKVTAQHHNAPLSAHNAVVTDALLMAGVTARCNRLSLWSIKARIMLSNRVPRPATCYHAVIAGGRIEWGAAIWQSVNKLPPPQSRNAPPHASPSPFFGRNACNSFLRPHYSRLFSVIRVGISGNNTAICASKWCAGRNRYHRQFVSAFRHHFGSE